jgi:hypothetical protein
LKKSTENYRVRKSAIAILHYLRDHPQAKDGVEGIAQWWIGEEREIVEKALALLVKEGVIEKREHVYQLTQSRLEPDDKERIDKDIKSFSTRRKVGRAKRKKPSLRKGKKISSRSRTGRN